MMDEQGERRMYVPLVLPAFPIVTEASAVKPRASLRSLDALHLWSFCSFSGGIVMVLERLGGEGTRATGSHVDGASHVERAVTHPITFF